MLPVLYRCAIGALLYLANLCYICNLWPNWEMCLLLFNIGHDICPGPVFRCKFNGGVHFAIRLTIFGNFSQCAIYIPSGPIFQCEFNCNSYYVIWRLNFHKM